ncbi:hypothetical protein AMECASPLE_023637 [Ameca splendens]|uniref:Uncharacterized protein n=1 Tax=Ameca splendens TaxID=208324 RepID=A0ABV0YR22_9TELE
MVNTSVTLPQSKDRSGSTRSDLEIVPRFTCLACPPGGTHWHSTLACQPQSPGLARVSPEPTRSPTIITIERILKEKNFTLQPS